MDWMKLLDPILGAIGVGLAGIITTFLVKLLQAKTGIALDENQQKQAKEIVLGIEEKAIDLLKKQCVKTPGPVKKADAIDQLKVLNPDLTTKEAASQIDRAVGSSPVIGAFQPSCGQDPPIPGLPQA